MIPEPSEVTPESRFEAAIIEAVREITKEASCNCTVIPRFGLDVAFFLKTSNSPYARFLEVKCFTGARPGGVGFGDGRGDGLQVDLLLRSEAELHLMDCAVRWVLADATKPVGSPRYAVFNSHEAKAAAMNGVSKGKQNNLRIAAFRDRLVNWPVFYQALKSFLLS
jgi:hypothetical protein